MRFRLASYFNPNLAPGGRRVDAVLTLTAEVDARAGASGPRVVGLILDCSGSMFNQGKIEAAKHAARRCIALLPDDTHVFVVAFGSDAEVVVPLAKASPEAKAKADRIVQRLDNRGGTEMSKALDAARGTFAAVPDAIAYALFLTDGANEGERPPVLAAAIDRCRGVFQCDCRGIGTDWQPAELRNISNALLGTADAVADPARLEAEFRAALERALAKGMGDVRLDLWRPGTSRLVSLRQMQPENVDITAMGVKASERVTSFPLGAWGTESRDYHAVFEVVDGAVGDEMLVCRPSVTWSEADAPAKAGGNPVVATWSEDADLTARISPEVAHYTGQAELADTIREGLEAKNRGNLDQATRLLGRAARIAAASGNAEVTRRLSKVVDVVDAAEGTVRLRRDAGKGEELELEMGGTRTVRRPSV